MMVGCNFEQFGRVLQPMDFIQHDALATQTVEKALWIKHHAANPREFTVEIFNFGEILTKAGFSNPPHASEPDDGSLLPCAFEQFQPESPMYHTKLYLHIVALNANTFQRCVLFFDCFPSMSFASVNRTVKFGRKK